MTNGSGKYWIYCQVKLKAVLALLNFLCISSNELINTCTSSPTYTNWTIVQG